MARNRRSTPLLRLVLASGSPRRRALLSQLGRPFTVEAAEVDETPRPGERPWALVRRLAAMKAVTVGERLAQPGTWTLGADTVVAAAGDILGKPADAAEARAMLRLLSGRTHQVYTGVALWDYGSGQGWVRVAVAAVTFRTLSPLEIEEYVAGGEPVGKAGAYAVQGRAGAWVTALRGNVETVIGLPLDVTQELLALAQRPHVLAVRRRG